MVYMTHHRNDRCARQQVIFVVDLFLYGVLYLGTNVFGLEAKLVGHNIDGLSIETLVDGNHDADAHACTDNLDHGHVHHRCQFRYGNKLREFQHLALCCLGSHLFIHTLCHGIALLFAVLCTLLVEICFRGQSCQCFLHLACYVFLVHFDGLESLLVLFLLATALLIHGHIAEVLVSTLRATVGRPTILAFLLVGRSLLLTLLFGSSLNIYLSVANAFALALLTGLSNILATLLRCFFLTLLAFLFFRFLFWTRALIDAREVYFAQHIHLRSQFSLALQGIDFRSHRGILYFGRFCGFFRFCKFHRLYGFWSLFFARCFLNLYNRLRLLYNLYYWFLFYRCLFLFNLYLSLDNRLRLWFRLNYGLRLSFFRLRACRLQRSLGRLRLSQTAKVNLAKRCKLLPLSDLFLRLRFHYFRLLFLFLREKGCSLLLHGFVATELSDQSLVLLITNLCVRGGIVANFAQTPFAFQEINCRLKSYIQFC